MCLQAIVGILAREELLDGLDGSMADGFLGPWGEGGGHGLRRQRGALCGSRRQQREAGHGFPPSSIRLREAQQKVWPVRQG